MFGFPEQSRCLFGRSYGVHGWEVLSWSVLAAGLRPEVWEREAHEPGCSRQGWQHEAASRVEEKFREALFPQFVTQPSSVAQVSEWSRSRCSFLCDPLRRCSRGSNLSCSGCCSNGAFTFLCSVKSHLRMWPSTRTHVATIPQLVVGRGFPLESAAARICREGGARVVPNMLVRNMDLDVPVTSGGGRRWIAYVGWRPIGYRHHSGVCVAR